MNLPRLPIPGLFITATDTGVGKTIIAGAIARSLKSAGRRVAVLKPVATGCASVREGLVSEDAEFLAAASDTHHPLDLICPNRYQEALAPSVAARRAKQPLDWEAVARSIRIMSADSDAMIIEGVGGVLAPLDDKTSVRDMIVALGTPAVIAARAGLGTINHTLLTIEALRSAGVPIAGVVINRYPTDSVGIAEESAPREIERIAKAPILAIVPEERIHLPTIPAGIMSAIAQVDWEALLG
ncbi:MAG: dethiobiotin synthase [Burkholderiales bacterium]|nr:dethiobiotin synthase [Phycisphaerae bacterium]